LGEEKKVEMNLPGNPDFGRMIGKKQKSTREIMPSTKALWKGFSGDGGFCCGHGNGRGGALAFLSNFLTFHNI